MPLARCSRLQPAAHGLCPLLFHLAGRQRGSLARDAPPAHYNPCKMRMLLLQDSVRVSYPNPTVCWLRRGQPSTPSRSSDVGLVFNLLSATWRGGVGAQWGRASEVARLALQRARDLQEQALLADHVAAKQEQRARIERLRADSLQRKLDHLRARRGAGRALTAGRRGADVACTRRASCEGETPRAQ